MVCPMAKPTTVYVCRDCGGESLRWAGQCPHCQAWNTLEEYTVRKDARPNRGLERAAGAPRPRPQPITEIATDGAPRLVLEWGELNRVLGGGVVPGSLVLFGGEPGVGKSTLLMHLAAQAARAHRSVLYATGEESAQQVRLRAERVGALEAGLLLLAENDLDAILAATAATAPGLLVVDSIQTVYDPSVESAAGSVTQVRESTGRLMRMAKESGLPVLLVGHVTKEGAIAGPRVLEHMVDTVLYLEGERQQDLRILRATKNRFGSTDEIGIFSMGEGGLEEVQDAGAALLSTASLGVPGTAVVPALEGSRPLLVEIQSLVGKAPSSESAGPGFPPRRSATGFDPARMHMILAILERRAGISVAARDVYVNVAGGLRLGEPAADLALALSIAGNVRDRALPEGTVVIGELGLTGEVRRVGRLEARLEEASRRGFTRAIVPRGAQGLRTRGLEVVEVRDLKAALEAAELSVLRVESGSRERL